MILRWSPRMHFFMTDLRREFMYASSCSLLGWGLCRNLSSFDYSYSGAGMSLG